MKKLYLTIVIALFYSLFPTQTGFAKEKIMEKSPTFYGQRNVPGEIIVKFKKGVKREVIEKINKKHNTSILYTSPFAGFKKIKVPIENIAEMVEIYQNDPNVEYAEQNYIVHALMVPNDPLYPYQWHLDNPHSGGINMQAAWDIQTGDPNVIVAVLDTGVAYEDYEQSRNKKYYLAPDLAETTFVQGYDFINQDEHANDDNGHGTHVTGTIAQNTNNYLGIAGIAFNTAIMPVKVLDKNGSGTVADIADGIIFATDNYAHIINLSLGGEQPSITLENACEYAYNRGVLIVASSGNDGLANMVCYPAVYKPYCIAVGATRYDETVAYYSNRGPDLDLVAPGGDLYMDQNGDGYGDGILQQTFDRRTNNWGYWFYQGTSMAAPHVSGVAALLIASDIATIPDHLRMALQDTAQDLGTPGRDDIYGSGLLDAYAALNWDPGQVDNFPEVTITSPLDEDAVSGTITIEADASDDIGVAQVDFYIDDTYLATDTTSPYSVEWDSSTVDDGEYEILALAIDTADQGASDYIIVTVDNINDPPVADAGPDQEVYVGDTVNFDASGSSDPDDQIVDYIWDFDDADGLGEDAVGITAANIYSAVGTYIVTLTVFDSGDLSSQDTATVTVTEPPTGDVITITKAEYKVSKSELKVEATSSQGGTAVLTVDGYGQMTYNNPRNLYQFSEKSVPDPEGSITVTSSLGGEQTVAVTYK